MHSRLLAVLLAAGLLGLSGCADSNDPRSTDDLGQAAEQLDLEATDTTGVVRGIVVDEAVTPVAGAVVTLRGNGATQEATTTEAGVFGFEDLPAGTYFLLAHKLGYFDTQQSVEVQAGVDDPPVAKILLAANPEQLPSFEVYEFDGFLSCSVTLAVYFFPCKEYGDPLGDDNWAAEWSLSGNATFIHVSLVWKPTQPVGTELYYNLCDTAFGSCDIVDYAGGVSPLVTDTPEDELGPINAAGTFGLQVTGNGEQGIAGIEYQQGFKAIAVVFYGFTPPEGYAFHKDGAPQLPS